MLLHPVTIKGKNGVTCYEKKRKKALIMYMKQVTASVKYHSTSPHREGDGNYRCPYSLNVINSKKLLLLQLKLYIKEEEERKQLGKGGTDSHKHTPFTSY